MATRIETYADHRNPATLRRIRDIFFLSAAAVNVTDDEVKNEAFFKKWTEYYFANRPELILLAIEDGQILAYLMGEFDSDRARAHFAGRIGSYETFADLYQEYPAHLHMNAHPEARGRGVGTKLIEDYIRRLKMMNVKGVHLITSPEQRNVHFYRKNGFTDEVVRDFKGHPLLFMGRKI